MLLIAINPGNWGGGSGRKHSQGSQVGRNELVLLEWCRRKGKNRRGLAKSEEVHLEALKDFESSPSLARNKKSHTTLGGPPQGGKIVVPEADEGTMRDRKKKKESRDRGGREVTKREQREDTGSAERKGMLTGDRKKGKRGEPNTIIITAKTRGAPVYV